MRSGVRLLILIGGAPLPALADNFILTAPKILRFLSCHEGPFIAKVRRHPHDPGKPGSVEMWLSEKNWEAGSS